MSSLSDSYSLVDYLDVVLENPRLNRSAHKRAYDMCMYYDLFCNPPGLFGIKQQMDSFEQYIAGASIKGSFEKRILLFIGPPGAGKSEFTDLLKKHTESYSYEDGKGEIYAPSVCPIQENPLNWVPLEMREELKEDYAQAGFLWEHNDMPCPMCQEYIDKQLKKYNGDWNKVFADTKVDRLFFSEHKKRGIYKHVPTDQYESMADMTGDVNFQGLKESGKKSAAGAHDWSGIFHANRGLLDMTELFKSKRALWKLFLELSQAQKIELPDFSYIKLETLIVAHSNYPEYKNFMDTREEIPLQRRFYKIDWPFNMIIGSEKKIALKTYDKIETMTHAKIHIAPYALDLLAATVIRTRHKKFGIAAGADPHSKIDGMQGITSSLTEDVLTLAYKRALKGSIVRDEKPTTCISYALMLDSLKNVISTASSTQENRDKYLKEIDTVSKGFEKSMQNLIRDTLVPALRKDEAQTMFLNYMTECIKFAQGEEFNEELCLDIEQHLVAQNVLPEVIDAKRKSFAMQAKKRNWVEHNLSYRLTDPLLVKAINTATEEALRNTMGIFSKTKEQMSDDEKEQIRVVKKQLLKKKPDLCKHCLDEMLANHLN